MMTPERFTGSFTQQEPIPEAGIEAALAVLRHGRLHRYNTVPGERAEADLLEEEFAKFLADCKPEESEAIPALRTYFKAYVTSDQVRHIIESKHFTDLATNPVFTTRDFKAVPQKYRTLIPDYVKDYVSLNLFIA